MSMTAEKIIHPFAPIFDETSRVLILGTMPSPKSRENQFYYGHPRNRFWPVLAGILNEPLPRDIPEKTGLLLRHHIALWDVLAACEISGADDASIRDPQPNDLSVILNHCPVRAVFTNGKKAGMYYRKFQSRFYPELPHVELPSTSPANCGYGPVEKLQIAYAVLLDYLK